MSRGSTAVKDWRRKTKQRIVFVMGSKCFHCKLKTDCAEVFDLHHINPEEKSFSMSGIRANPMAWELVVIELRKCLLLCANCHRMVEAEFITLKNPKSTFNEKLATYIPLNAPSRKRLGIKAKCAYCQKKYIQYSKTQKYCTNICQGRYRKK